MDIQIIDDATIRFQKRLWHESESILAKCFGFDTSLEAEKGIINCNMLVTSKKSIYDFIKLSFKNFSEALSEAGRREEFFLKVDYFYTVRDSNVDAFINKHLPYHAKMYKHQIDVLHESFNRQFNFMALEMGLGKTLTSASLSRVHQIPRTVIICPAAVKWNWYRDLTEKFGFNELFFTILDSTKRRTMMALNERFVIINYDIASKFHTYLVSAPVGHIILDECFVYDTLIETDLGPLKIGDIVEKRIICNALSYDSLNNTYIYKPISNWLKKPLNKKLVKIKSDGREIICTEDHKVWTCSGFKRAKEISCEDMLCTMQFGVHNSNKREIHGEILHNEMCGKMEFSKHELQPEFIGSSKKSKAKSENDLLNLSNRSNGSEITSKKKSKVLLSIMFGKMENDKSRVKSFKKTNGQNISIREDEKNAPRKSGHSKKTVDKNEVEPNNVYIWGERKNDKITDWSNIFISWRKWPANCASKITARINRMGNGTRYKNLTSERGVPIYSNSLQGRFSDSSFKNSDRSGREYPQAEKMEIPRQEKNGNFKFSRVESCEILERGNNEESERMYRESFVYDLTVEDNHNYFANGILVSNCHLLKNHHSLRFKSVIKILEQFPDAKITFLSGTPIKNRVNDVFAYLKLIGNELGQSYKKFLDQYTIKTNNRGGERVTGGKNLQDLYVKLSNFMIRKTKEECLDLPDKIYFSYKYELDDYQDEYDKIIKELSELKDYKGLSGNLHSLNIITSKAKIPGIIELAEEILLAGKKVVIFGGYKEPLAMLESHFGNKCVKIDGSVDSWSRDQLVRRFVDDPECTVFLGNMISAGVGINLVNASDIIFLNFPFTPSELYQAIDRCHRIGQSNSVNVHYTFCDESIDGYIHDIIVSKELDINALIDQGKEANLRENFTEILMKKLLKKDVEINDVPVTEVNTEVQKEEVEKVNDEPDSMLDSQKVTKIKEEMNKFFPSVKFDSPPDFL